MIQSWKLNTDAVCEEPTRLFCHTCGIEAEKIAHPACLVIDLNKLVVESLRQK
ncbi:hypothetical protein AAA799P11_00552 [Marine Group I thaumarchaeote SCGC AAA799-P11]|uniref:Uncharacterized protein n=1 Tax=Marine Group I thaumarchaeote SCGC AAA799-P11 TaxID=1502295 RepID=A0A087S1F9_9ARCH|nr:hypothetical protein AAA799P11_00552 [Marine Group I thaumarchaeote SCGC AAA799-P11]